MFVALTNSIWVNTDAIKYVEGVHDDRYTSIHFISENPQHVKPLVVAASIKVIMSKIVGVKWIGSEESVQEPSLTVQEPPSCPNHKEVQHRDRKLPWCNECGWRYATPSIPGVKGRGQMTKSETYLDVIVDRNGYQVALVCEREECHTKPHEKWIYILPDQAIPEAAVQIRAKHVATHLKMD